MASIGQEGLWLGKCKTSHGDSHYRNRQTFQCHQLSEMVLLLLQQQFWTMIDCAAGQLHAQQYLGT